MMTNTYKPEGMLLSGTENHEYISSRAGLERALEKQIILEAPAILCDKNFDLHVSLCHGVHGVIARDEVQYLPEHESVKDIAILTRVGKPVCFKVTGFSKEEDGTCIAHLSRRAAQQECMHMHVAGLRAGDILSSKITHLESFGAFVDIGCGIISLLSIDCISVSRISHPKARLSVGQTLPVVVRSVDDRGRIYVSVRELLGSWEQNAALFSEGQTVRGIVRSVEPYGVFVELTPNLAGLAECKDNTHPGQTCAVYIKSIIPEKMKIKLIIIDAHDEPPSSEPLRYFVDPVKTAHLDAWRYSPPCCKRVIETVFS